MSFMFEEILSQAAVIDKVLREYVHENKIQVDIPRNLKKIVFIASGSSYNAARLISELFKYNFQIVTECFYSSEFEMQNFNESNNDTAYVFVSQSGETTDTVNAFKSVKLVGACTLAVTNNPESTLSKNVEYNLNIFAGKEKSIAATKSFTAQVVCLYLIMLKFIENSTNKSINKNIITTTNTESHIRTFSKPVNASL